MIRYSCTECQRTLLIKPSLAGQGSKCPCGASFTVPDAPKAAAPKAAFVAPNQTQVASPAPQPRAQQSGTQQSGTQQSGTQQSGTQQSGTQPTPQAGSLGYADVSTSLVVGCSKCERQLRAPQTAAGKAVRCPCGQLVMVPVHKSPESKRGSTVVSVVRKETNSDWLKSLPPPQVLHAPPPQNGAEFWYVDVEPEDYEPPPPVTVPDARQLSHEYIRGAEKELSEQRKRGSSGALGTAQVLMILVGLISIGINGFLFYNAPNEVQEAMKGGDVGMSQESLLQFVQMLYGAFIAVGVAMLILGALIYQFPVFCPLAGLILYIIAMIVSGILNPASLLKGIIFKVLVILALGKAVGDGANYR